MAAQLKGLAGKLRKIGGIQSLDFGKKRVQVGSVSGSGARDAESTDNRDPPAVERIPIVNEPVPGSDGPAGVGYQRGPVIDKGPEELFRKRKETADSAHVSGEPVAKRGAPTPKTFKHWLSSLPAEDRKVEMFDNYVSAHDMRVYQRESLETFIANLFDDVTLVSSSFFCIFTCVFVLVFFLMCLLFSVELPCFRLGYHCGESEE